MSRSEQFSFKENCELRRKDNVKGQISAHLLTSNGDCFFLLCLLYPFQILFFLDTRNLKIEEHYSVISQI